MEERLFQIISISAGSALNLVPHVPNPSFRNAVQLRQNTDVPECGPSDGYRKSTMDTKTLTTFETARKYKTSITVPDKVKQWFGRSMAL